MSDLSGTVISDRYELTSLLGQGGQGVVYRAEDRVEKRSVAVKVLPVAARNKELSARLAREQEALVALAGTSAVGVYDLCEGPRGALCLVMEFLEGEDLEKRLQDLEDRGDRLPLARLMAIAEPLVETLERAHEAGILHRDLKPANVFLLSESAGGGVRLLDFGLSRMRSAMPLTAAGTIVGSPSYMAPEVWKGSTEDLDRRADVYSFGVILFRALAGRLPFTGESLQEKFAAATTARRPSLHALRPDLPKRLDAWTERALAVDRNERYQTVQALWSDLLGALNYSPTPGAIRPVAQGIVTAWRKASDAFRRFVTPEERPSPAEAAKASSGVEAPAPAKPATPEPEATPTPREPALPVVPPPLAGLPAVPPPPPRARAKVPTTEVDDTQKTLFWNRPPVELPDMAAAPTIAAAPEAHEPVSERPKESTPAPIEARHAAPRRPGNRKRSAAGSKKTKKTSVKKKKR